MKLEMWVFSLDNVVNRPTSISLSMFSIVHYWLSLFAIEKHSRWGLAPEISCTRRTFHILLEQVTIAKACCLCFCEGDGRYRLICLEGSVLEETVLENGTGGS